MCKACKQTFLIFYLCFRVTERSQLPLLGSPYSPHPPPLSPYHQHTTTISLSMPPLPYTIMDPTRTALRENCQGPTRTAQQGIMEDPTREVLLENLMEAAMNISRRNRRDRTFFAPKTFTLCCENSSRLSQSVTESQFVQ